MLPLQALELWGRRGHDAGSMERLGQQLFYYRLGRPPYNAPFVKPFVLLDWWSGLAGDSTREIVGLACVLASVVPHAAEVERMFSSMGLQQTKLRNRLSTDVNLMATTIRTQLLQGVPRRVWVLRGGDGAMCMRKSCWLLLAAGCCQRSCCVCVPAAAAGRRRLQRSWWRMWRTAQLLR